MEKQRPTELDVITTFGEQITRATIAEYVGMEDPNAISESWPELRGREHHMLALAHWMRTRERIALGHLYSPTVGNSLAEIEQDIAYYAHIAVARDAVRKRGHRL